MDPIVDMLNRIRNGYAVEKESIDVPYSRLKFEIAQVLEKYGFVGKLERSGKKGKKLLHVALNYVDGKPKIEQIKRISTQGQRIYTACSDLKKVMGGAGISILSTSKGIMSNIDARKQKVGGEIIAQVW